MGDLGGRISHSITLAQHCTYERRKRVDHQARPHHDQQIGLWQVSLLRLARTINRVLTASKQLTFHV